ncbi:MAG: 2,3-bisphosphoglycerate-independent phosphoglycerate mutase [Gemmatimonadota bacterium]|jgi:2,3-bisphosphoglycerate-independent phosphoglycerate mutase
MSDIILPDAQVHRGHHARIVLVVMDGLGGLPRPETGKTELETARTPNLDHLADRASLGMLDPVGRGITAGSGPGHLSLFGYDPLRYVIGRGVLSALGVGIDLRHGDLAARLNLATFDGQGRVSDRRAGRPSDEEGRRVVKKVMDALEQPDGYEISLTHEKEHRVVLLIRGEGLGEALTDTDPLEAGVEDLRCEANDSDSEKSAELVRNFLSQARDILSDEPAMNGFLARGFATYERIPTVEERYGLKAVALAKYPMYRGVAKLVGMDVPAVPGDVEETVALYEKHGRDHDFSFLHFKDTDTRGHDGDFDGKVEAIEAVDHLIPRILETEPEVLVVTGDHATPALYQEHSWHAVPVLLWSRWPRPTGGEFGESACRRGDLGRFHGTELMSLALAHAGRLVKYGA